MRLQLAETARIPVSIRAPVRGPERFPMTAASIPTTLFQSALRSEGRSDDGAGETDVGSDRFNPRSGPRAGAMGREFPDDPGRRVSIRAPVRGPERLATLSCSNAGSVFQSALRSEGRSDCHSFDRESWRMVSIRAPVRGPERSCSLPAPHRVFCFNPRSGPRAGAISPAATCWLP